MYIVTLGAFLVRFEWKVWPGVFLNIGPIIVNM